MTTKTAVYLIENTMTGDVYVGSTQDHVTRWYNHQYSLGKGCHANRRLQRAWIKYGAAAFVFRVLETPPIAELLLVEQRYLDQYTPEHRYNHHPRAGTARGYKHSTQTKDKIRQRQLGHVMPPQVAAALKKANTGRVRPVSEREQIAKSLRGRTTSPETRRKLSAANKGKTPSALAAQRSRAYNRTHPQSASTIEKRAKSLRGRKYSPRGPLTDARRAALSASTRGKPKSMQTRERMCCAKAATRRPVKSHDPVTRRCVAQYDKVAAVVNDGFSRTGVLHALRSGGCSGGLVWRYVVKDVDDEVFKL